MDDERMGFAELHEHSKISEKVGRKEDGAQFRTGYQLNGILIIRESCVGRNA